MPRERGTSDGGATDAPPDWSAPAWLLRHRVTVPEPTAHHVHRGGLIDRCLPTHRPLTVLLAGGGFGKTTLLADCCRTLREKGVPTAWLSLEDDAPGMLDNYLALAFEAAGLDVRLEAVDVEPVELPSAIGGAIPLAIAEESNRFEEVLAEFYGRTLFIPGHLGLAAGGVDFDTEDPRARHALETFAGAVPSISPIAFALQGYPSNRVMFNALISRLGEAIVGEITLDEAYGRMGQDVEQQLAEKARQ